MPSGCPSCGRPVAVARPSCLYCGAALGAAEPRPTQSAAAHEAPPRRVVIAVDLVGAPAAQVAAALGVSAYEAGQRALRGGLQLHRVSPPEQAPSEIARIVSAGIPVYALPEAEVRALAAPQLAHGGRDTGSGLALRTLGGDITVAPGAVLLVVRGPITREYQPAPEIKRVRLATLEQGYRIHLHRRDALPPLELDPDNFNFGAWPPLGGSLIQLSSWADALAQGAPTDDCFRRLPPALAATEPVEGMLSPQTLSRQARNDPAAALILDNLAQFRFHSAWRGAVARRLAGLSATPD